MLFHYFILTKYVYNVVLYKMRWDARVVIRNACVSTSVSDAHYTTSIIFLEPESWKEEGKQTKAVSKHEMDRDVRMTNPNKKSGDKSKKQNA